MFSFCLSSMLQCPWLSSLSQPTPIYLNGSYLKNSLHPPIVFISSPASLVSDTTHPFFSANHINFVISFISWAPFKQPIIYLLVYLRLILTSNIADDFLFILIHLAKISWVLDKNSVRFLSYLDGYNFVLPLEIINIKIYFRILWIHLKSFKEIFDGKGQ